MLTIEGREAPLLVNEESEVEEEGEEAEHGADDELRFSQIPYYYM